MTYLKETEETRKIKKVIASKENLKQELGREPFVEEIAVDTGLDVKTVSESLYLKIEEEEVHDHELRFKLTIKNHELEKARKAMNMEQKEVARLTGIGFATYSQIECCRLYPSKERQEKISKVLKSKPGVLFPEWLQAFSTKWKNTEKERIIPISKISLDSPEILSLESGDYQNLFRVKDAEMFTEKALEVLRERERLVIELRYGLNGNDPHTFDQVGKIIGVQRERVRQIETVAFERIRGYADKISYKF